MAGASIQQLIGEVRAALASRGLRHAAHNTVSGVTNVIGDSYIPRVFHVLHNTAVPNDSTKTYIVLEFDSAVVSGLDEKAWGNYIDDGSLPS